VGDHQKKNRGPLARAGEKGTAKTSDKGAEGEVFCGGGGGGGRGGGAGGGGGGARRDMHRGVGNDVLNRKRKGLTRSP